MQQFRDDVYLQVTLSQEPLRSGVLLFEFAQAGGVGGGSFAEAGAPAVETVLGDVALAADLGDSVFAFSGLLQEEGVKTATICSSLNWFFCM